MPLLPIDEVIRSDSITLLSNSFTLFILGALLSTTHQLFNISIIQPYLQFLTIRKAIYSKLYHYCNLITNFPDSEKNDFVWEKWKEARPEFRELATELTTFFECDLNWFLAQWLKLHGYNIKDACSYLIGLSNAEKDCILRDDDIRLSLKLKRQIKDDFRYSLINDRGMH